MGKTFYKLIGMTGVTLELGEVYGGLHTGMVDVVFASAYGAVLPRWIAQTPYVSQSGWSYMS
jgi:TRAP-type C4-dicarboxylate transport system substrate-binding protein